MWADATLVESTQKLQADLASMKSFLTRAQEHANRQAG